MTIGLTNLKIDAVAGQPALLPNQPIFHNCHVTGADLKCGDIVTLAEGDNKGVIMVKKAAATDEPFGVVVYNGIKTGFKEGDLISVYPENACVFLPAGAAAIKRGKKLQFNAAGQVLATSTASNGYIGVALTEGTVIGDLLVVKIKTSI